MGGAVGVALITSGGLASLTFSNMLRWAAARNETVSNEMANKVQARVNISSREKRIKRGQTMKQHADTTEIT